MEKTMTGADITLYKDVLELVQWFVIGFLIVRTLRT